MSRNKIFMKLTSLGRHLFHNKAGRNLLDLSIGMLYIDALRKVMFALADNWLQRGSFWRAGERPGWGRIYRQYQQVARAVLYSLERGMRSKTLSPRVARIILHLWGGMIFPTAARQKAVEQFQEKHGCKPPWFLVISPTRACNLQCEGCYANAGAGSAPLTGESLAWEVLDRVMAEAKTAMGGEVVRVLGRAPLCSRFAGRGPAGHRREKQGLPVLDVHQRNAAGGRNGREADTVGQPDPGHLSGGAWKRRPIIGGVRELSGACWRRCSDCVWRGCPSASR